MTETRAEGATQIDLAGGARAHKKAGCRLLLPHFVTARILCIFVVRSELLLFNSPLGVARVSLVAPCTRSFYLPQGEPVARIKHVP